MTSLSLTVLNVKCEGCVSNIINGLSTIDSIENVDVDVNAGIVKITGTNLDESNITSKLSELGYPESSL